MVTELKPIQKNYDFYLADMVSEDMYASLRKEVDTAIRTIEENRENNREWYRNNNIDSDVVALTKPTFNFHLSTFGGDCYSGLGICDMLMTLDYNPLYNVKMFCEGKVMSMGIPILLSVRDRVCTQNTTFMFHQLMAINLGKLEDIKERVNELNRLQKSIDNIVLKHSKITKEQLDDWYSRKLDFFCDAEEALKLGLVTDIIKF